MEYCSDGCHTHCLHPLPQEELKALLASEHKRLDQEKAARSADSAGQEEGGEDGEKGVASL